MRQTLSLQGSVAASLHKTAVLRSSRHMHRKAQILPSKKEAEKRSLSPHTATELHKSETWTPKYLPPEQRSLSTQKSKQTVSSQGSV